MGNNYRTEYNVDIVMCIDATGSMGLLINMVKAKALSFYDDLTESLALYAKRVNQFWVRVIAFRDYLADGENAMLMSDFFELPEQAEQFKNLVNRIEPIGGGDDPGDGLEALAYAIKSKWNQSEGKKRHVIVIWTDDATHYLGFGRKAPNYPAKMAKSFNELSEWWGVGRSPDSVMDFQAKRLLIFAPHKEPWSTIASTWENTILFPSAAGNGLVDRTYTEILDALFNL